MAIEHLAPGHLAPVACDLMGSSVNTQLARDVVNVAVVEIGGARPALGDSLLALLFLVTLCSSRCAVPPRRG